MAVGRPSVVWLCGLDGGSQPRAGWALERSKRAWRRPTATLPKVNNLEPTTRGTTRGPIAIWELENSFLNKLHCTSMTMCVCVFSPDLPEAVYITLGGGAAHHGRLLEGDAEVWCTPGSGRSSENVLLVTILR